MKLTYCKTFSASFRSHEDKLRLNHESKINTKQLRGRVDGENRMTVGFVTRRLGVGESRVRLGGNLGVKDGWAGTAWLLPSIESSSLHLLLVLCKFRRLKDQIAIISVVLLLRTWQSITSLLRWFRVYQSYILNFQWSMEVYFPQNLLRKCFKMQQFQEI